ncbi:hypothetical protein [Enterococcus phage ECP3]|uniref:Uncharacterized protein n=1 Tax=Enterococcus phage ECP3 TaxID=1498168 RepID=A0A096XSY3_9CAUD|nr:hypothetical protein [Enterococcus phage ECP3]AII28417.1 hypothetical protein [Enterococcus phage ECP3]
MYTKKEEVVTVKHLVDKEQIRVGDIVGYKKTIRGFDAKRVKDTLSVTNQIGVVSRVCDEYITVHDFFDKCSREIWAKTFENLEVRKIEDGSSLLRRYENEFR